MTDLLQVGGGLLFLSVLTVIAWGVVAKLFANDDAGLFVRRLFLAAVVLRAALALGSYFALPYGALAPDETGYLKAAQLLLVTGRFDLARALNGSGWIYFNAFLFHAFGFDPLLPRFWNCVVGGATAVLSFALARRLGAGSAARATATLVAIFPSLVLWSSLNLKDADVDFLILLGLLLALRLQEARQAVDVSTLGVVLLTLLTLRQFACVVLLVAIVVARLASLRPARRTVPFAESLVKVVGPVLLVCVLLLISAAVIPSVGEAIFKAAGPERLAHLRHALALGAGSATNPDPGLDTFAGIVAFLPTGLVDFLLRPFPWERGSLISLLTRPETIAYYVLLVPAIGGIAINLRSNASRALPPLSFLALSAIGYALVLSNLGTIYRERSQLYPILFAFAAVGAGRWWPVARPFPSSIAPPAETT